MSTSSKTLYTFLLTALIGAITVFFTGTKKSSKGKRQTQERTSVQKDDLFI